jgi:3-hydroxyacyl-[acyl-carrier-protein] dehydratase
MLKDHFYQIREDETLSEERFVVKIELNKEHAIFQGHFPGKPIVPGVCMLQIVKEIVSEKLKKQLIFKTSSNIKFMALINPFETPILQLNFQVETKENGDIAVKNESFFNATPALKLSVIYSVAQI